MKTDRLLLLSLIIVTLLCACAKPQAEEQPYSITAIQSQLALTKAQVTGSEDMLVTLQDIERYIHFQTLAQKSKGQTLVVKEVEPIEYEGLLSLYVIEYESGFEILSADKRSQIPLVKEEKADYKMSEFNENFMGHVQCLAGDVWLSLYHPDLLAEPDEEAAQQIQACLDFWRMVNADADFVAEHAVQTKSFGDSLPMLNGHWELIGVTTAEVVYDSIPHMTTTLWHQQQPYNDLCPKEFADDPDRCPAGCVAVAGAQMLYYLHYELGVPEESPSQGLCSGTGPGAIQWFGALSDTTWSHMASFTFPSDNGSDYFTACLIGDVSYRIHTIYHNTGSSANLEDLVSLAFAPYGVYSEFYQNYLLNSSLAVSSLQDGFPVVFGAKARNYQPSGNYVKVGHAFLLDGYKRCRTEYKSTYEWVADDLNPGGGLLPPPIRKVEVTYGSPHVSYFQMNWGWYTFGNSVDTWSSIYGSWQYQNEPPYDYEREFICNFDILDEN